MVRARGRAQRTRSPRSRRKNGSRTGRAGAGQLGRTGRESIERAANHPAGPGRGQGGWYRGTAAGCVPSLQRSEHKPANPAVPRPLEESDAPVRRS